MLDITTKQKINDLKDILVGKVPDPKSQVEQITIALFYKFMWDMDNEVKELGGKPKFFAGKYEKYSWEKLFSPGLSGEDRLKLYSEAIQKMEENPNIPRAFREIYKRAYLPYNDSSTLKLFLKAANEFHYSNSEKLGDAFEHLLSILGTQGDAGQFRTPRHIIDFITACVNPKKGETICDPACGTAGFVIAAYKHILKENTKDNPGDLLTPDDRKKISDNLLGLDIDPMMVKLSLANMYLHGFNKPHIYEYDTLTSEKRWNDSYDVILANPPFMTPKGGIKPHRKFSVYANKSEVLFVDFMADHLSQTGRAGIIVPEGIIFKSNEKAFIQLRENLVKNSLWAVISLPANIFKPYSAIKTSILLLDKNKAKKNDSILFIKIENDGFSLTEQRTPIDKNDLPKALDIIKNEKNKISNIAHLVKKNKIEASGDWNLSGQRYKVKKEIITNYNLVTLEEIIDYEQPTKYIVNSTNYNDSFKIPVLTAGKSFILGYSDETNGIFETKDLPVIIFDDFTTAIKFVDFPFKVKSSAMKILHIKRDKAIPKFIYHIMQNIDFVVNEHKRHWISQYSKIKVPLPSLEIQEKIVTEIENYEKKIENKKTEISELNQKIKDKITEVYGDNS